MFFFDSAADNTFCFSFRKARSLITRKLSEETMEILLFRICIGIRCTNEKRKDNLQRDLQENKCISNQRDLNDNYK